ncbi:hypothetical protein Taro_050513 [Colocasia esculenta]|uniref:Uncharacterized protein n=1 Tax=Colocasia esculenta TaxID=4460 RepID=A0A843XED9_COLES|nr:hypothetical protein [Colocasia esculenta]
MSRPRHPLPPGQAAPPLYKPHLAIFFLHTRASGIPTREEEPNSSSRPSSRYNHVPSPPPPPPLRDQISCAFGLPFLILVDRFRSDLPASSPGHRELRKHTGLIFVFDLTEAGSCRGYTMGDLDFHQHSSTKVEDLKVEASFMSEGISFYVGLVGLLGGYSPRKRYRDCLETVGCMPLEPFQDFTPFVGCSCMQPFLFASNRHCNCEQNILLNTTAASGFRNL